MGQSGGFEVIYTIADGYYVRPLDEADLAGPYPSWFQDQEVTRYSSHGKFAYGLEHYRGFIRSLDHQTTVLWAICHDADGHIGNISLQGISAVNQNAEFAILMGDRRHWGRGVARAAGKTLLSHGFSKLNLQRIYCGTAATNVAMSRLAVSLGMQEEGRRRNQLWLDGAWVDVVEYGLLRSEWQQS